jgi:hypothetical protein
MYRTLKTVLLFSCLPVQFCFAQSDPATKIDSSPWTMHFQTTVIAQVHPAFRSRYSGTNSLADTAEPIATSTTATLFLGRRLWKGAALYFNPEVSGGQGLSFAKGVAGALNGETYRVGNVAPQVFIARTYFQQNFALGHQSFDDIDDDFNQIKDRLPSRRLAINIGKFSASDFFDDNAYSHDPRTQFLNWSLMGNGAWDYPANTRGYTMGFVAELYQPGLVIRFSSVAVPRIANSPKMEYNISKAHSETLEFEKKTNWMNRPGRIHLLFTNTYSRAPSYENGIQALATNDSFTQEVIAGQSENNRFGGKKAGIGLSIEQEMNSSLGLFSRLGWNDGRYVSWAFTEIDRTFTFGSALKGAGWKRPGDIVGLAVALNGISAGHREYLQKGGYGFIIGDGQLNYGVEGILETYYNAHLSNFFWFTFDYQFVLNPGYNRDRGPVNVFALRGHIEF